MFAVWSIALTVFTAQVRAIALHHITGFTHQSSEYQSLILSKRKTVIPDLKALCREDPVRTPPIQNHVADAVACADSPIDNCPRRFKSPHKPVWRPARAPRLGWWQIHQAHLPSHHRTLRPSPSKHPYHHLTYPPICSYLSSLILCSSSAASHVLCTSRSQSRCSRMLLACCCRIWQSMSQFA